MKFVNVKNDIAFRKIFGSEDKTEVLISFLNSVLKLSGAEQIKKVTIKNPYQFPKIIGLKATILDVKATDQKGRSFFVEMQISDKRGLDKRIQYYLSQGYCSQIDVGDEYPKLKPVIFVGIFDFKYFKNKNKYISRHVFLDYDNHEYSFKDLQMNFIELPKFKKTIDELDTLTDKWIYFIKNADNLEVIPQKIQDKGLKTAYEMANKGSWTKEELEDYIYAGMREADVQMREEFVVERAIEQGRRDNSYLIAKQMKMENEPIDKIQKYTGLTKEDIEKL